MAPDMPETSTPSGTTRPHSPGTTAPDIARAIDSALREAGGGRVAGVRTTYAYGTRGYLVQFIRGDWLCTASVDAATGEVTSIIDDSGLLPAGQQLRHRARRSPTPTVRLPLRTLRDAAAAPDDPAIAYLATDAGVAVVRLTGTARPVVEDDYVTGLGPTRRIVALPGGVAGTTTDGRAFRLDRDGRLLWQVVLPATAHTVAADPTATRLLVATGTGARELAADTGSLLDLCGTTPAHAVAYLPDGDRLVAGPRGDLSVTRPDGSPHWTTDLGDRPWTAWAQGTRVYVAGEGGLKEIAVGHGVVARWSAPARRAARTAVVTGGTVYTCEPGASVTRHDYATAGHHGSLPDLPAHPQAICLLHTPAGHPRLLTAHRDGLISTHPVHP
ncbi:hypothetical protein Asp14428_17650 [Actinoplanes sp. NBRC 14428]|nr:hypothetical protein Asp14428_17650 [Actinoplanes sp. NBRC 14428]